MGKGEPQMVEVNGKTILTRYKVAAVQEPPIFLERGASVEKACRLIDEAASRGASLVVFPETWLPGYPIWSMFDAVFDNPRAKKAYSRLFKNAVDVPGPAIERLGEACRKAGVFLAMGVHERTHSGTMYNCIVFIGKDGQLLGKHRKLVPTYHERMIWAHGDGSTLNVFDTEIGRLGGLVCYEHLMPLARYALYTQGVQVHAAVWPSEVKPNLIVCRNMAAEGRTFVIVACTYYPKSVLPDDLEFRERMDSLPDPITKGGSAIIGPDGDYIVEPIYSRETIYAEIDLERIVEEKQVLDVVGHYARPEVFTLRVNRSELVPTEFYENKPAEPGSD